MRPSFARRWSAPVALAATVVLAVTMTLDMFRERPQMDTTLPPVPDEVVAPDAIAPPKATSSELKQAAPALPRATARRDETQQPVRESAPSAVHLGAGRQGFASDAPRAADALRKRGDPKPASLPSAPGTSPHLRERPGVGIEAAELNALQAPAAAPAASPRPEAASVSAGVVSATAGRVVAPEANRRTPEKWLEDIRRLRSQGKTADAERELSEFRKRYPDYALPEDLR